MNKVKKIILSTGIFLIVLLIIVPFGLSFMIYQDNFGNRYETISWMARSLDEFEGLQAQRCTFESNKGQQIACYKYYKEINEANNPKGVVVIAHGLGGGGHNPYMDIADYLTTNGYVVFAYDATGNGESEGDSVMGLPQGVTDLDYAVRFIKDNAELKGLPVMLFGHSWGAYSVGSVLNLHPDIQAVVMVAGFNNSTDMIEEEGTRMAGDAIKSVLPYLSLIEKIKFGSYASYNCEDGFDASQAGVMIIHSTDDEMVSFENNYEMFYNKYRNNARFSFARYENRGHDYVYYSDLSRQYKEALNENFAEYVDSLDGELTADLKSAYMIEHLDKTSLFDLDLELMDRIVSFYDSYAE